MSPHFLFLFVFESNNCNNFKLNGSIKVLVQNSDQDVVSRLWWISYVPFPSIFYETPFILEKKHFGVKVVQRKVYIKFLLLALVEIAKVYSHQFIVDPSITVCGDAPKYAMKAFRFSWPIKSLDNELKALMLSFILAKVPKEYF